MTFLGPRIDWGCVCSLCDWSWTAASEEEAKVVSVLHVLVRHPEDYQKTTGKDPEHAAWVYQEQVYHYRKVL